LSKDAARGLSPDGKWALIQRGGKKDEPARLILQPTGIGQPTDVPLPPNLVVGPPADGHAAWSNDGRWMFLPLWRSGDSRSRAIYRYEDNGSWRAVTKEGVNAFFVVSPDGEWVATADADGVVTLYAVDGRPPKPLSGEHGRPVHWSADGRLHLAALGDVQARLYHRDLATGRIEPWRTIAPADPTGVTVISQVFVDRDERTYVYQYSRALMDLFLARDLR
jgi:hypothetical protein